MDDRAVEAVSGALAETRWLPVPCATEYLPALARDVLYALEKAGMPVVVLPEPDTQGRFALAGLLLAAASAAEAVSVAAAPREQPTDSDGDPICSECSMPEPAEWCWQQRVSCPFGKPPRSKP